MELFSSFFIRPFERLAHFLRRRETQPCAAQELAAVEKLQEECEAFDFNANGKKCRKRRCKVPEKCQLGEKEEEREVKTEEKISHNNEAEEEREPLRLEKIKKSGRVHQKKREMHSLEKLMEGGSELGEAGEKKKKKQQKATEPTPLLVVVKPLHSPIEEELPMPPSVSEHLAPPAARFQPLPPVTKPPESPQKTAPAPEEVVALRRPVSRKPELFNSSPLEPQELMLIDIEDEESEYVTFWASDFLKSERPQTPDAERKPRKMDAWLEKDSEVQEEAWECEVVDVKGFEEEDPCEMGDSSAIQGHASEKTELDELSMKLLSPDGPKNETQHTVNIQEKYKTKVPHFLFTWTEEKAKNKEEKKKFKEKEQREKELLLDRYMNDPKLKHLWINKHNHNYCFF